MTRAGWRVTPSAFMVLGLLVCGMPPGSASEEPAPLRAVRIVSIERIRPPRPVRVYTVTVEPTPTFFAQGLAVHNKPMPYRPEPPDPVSLTRRLRLQQTLEDVLQIRTALKLWGQAPRFNAQYVTRLLNAIGVRIGLEEDREIGEELIRLIGTRLSPIRLSLDRLGSSQDFLSQALRAAELLRQGVREAQRAERIREGFASGPTPAQLRRLTTRGEMLSYLNDLIRDGTIRLEGIRLTQKQYQLLRERAAHFGVWLPWYPSPQESWKAQPKRHRFHPRMYLNLGFVEPASPAEERLIQDSGLLRKHYKERARLYHPDHTTLEEVVRDYWWRVLQLSWRALLKRKGDLGKPWAMILEEDEWVARRLEDLLWRDPPRQRGRALPPASP